MLWAELLRAKGHVTSSPCFFPATGCASRLFLKRPGEGADSSLEARWVKDSEVLGPRCTAGTWADVALDGCSP